MVLRGEGLHGAIADTDPQATGVAPLPARATDPAAEKDGRLVNQWFAEARQRLKGHEPANMCTLRGFAIEPGLPKYSDVYKLKAACVAVYPMYKGVAALVGMDVIETTAHDTTADEFNQVAEIWNDYDFVFCHVKYTDSRGEDGNFDAKVKVIEEVDDALPILLGLKPDVLIVTGDHSTPATIRRTVGIRFRRCCARQGHICRTATQAFGERECMAGALGQFPATDLMPLALAHASRLQKFGA